MRSADSSDVYRLNVRTGRGTLLTTQFQLLQGQRSVSETYTFAEPIVVVARDDAGNAPATSNAITITPGQPAAIQLASAPAWVGGNKHATLSARLVDAFDNGVPDRAMVFSHLAGLGSLTPIDSLTDANGVARADFLGARQPAQDIRGARSNRLYAVGVTYGFGPPEELIAAAPDHLVGCCSEIPGLLLQRARAAAAGGGGAN